MYLNGFRYSLDSSFDSEEEDAPVEPWYSLIRNLTTDQIQSLQAIFQEKALKAKLSKSKQGAGLTKEEFVNAVDEVLGNILTVSSDHKSTPNRSRNRKILIASDPTLRHDRQRERIGLDGLREFPLEEPHPRSANETRPGNSGNFPRTARQSKLAPLTPLPNKNPRLVEGNRSENRARRN